MQVVETLSEALHELITLLKEKAANRLALVIADSDIYLNSSTVMCIYILELEASNAAGGRGAGYGSRKVTKIHSFACKNDVWVKKAMINDKGILEGFEPPHYVSLLPLTLHDGSEIVVYGAIDPSLVAEYDRKFHA